jgi:hypothetical protein
LDQGREALLVAQPVASFMSKVEQRAERRSGIWGWLRRPVVWASLATAGVAAAAAFVVIPGVGKRDAAVDTAAPVVDTVRWRGGAGLAVIRESHGKQERLVGTAELWQGAALRVELSTAEPGAWTVGVLSESGTFTPLHTNLALDAGRHLLEGALTSDGAGGRSTLVAAPSEILAEASRTGRLPKLPDSAVTLTVEEQTRP